MVDEDYYENTMLSDIEDGFAEEGELGKYTESQIRERIEKKIRLIPELFGSIFEDINSISGSEHIDITDDMRKEVWDSLATMEKKMTNEFYSGDVNESLEKLDVEDLKMPDEKRAKHDPVSFGNDLGSLIKTFCDDTEYEMLGVSRVESHAESRKDTKPSDRLIYGFMMPYVWEPYRNKEKEKEEFERLISNIIEMYRDRRVYREEMQRQLRTRNYLFSEIEETLNKKLEEYGIEHTGRIHQAVSSNWVNRLKWETPDSINEVLTDYMRGEINDDEIKRHITEVVNEKIAEEFVEDYLDQAPKLTIVSDIYEVLEKDRDQLTRNKRKERLVRYAYDNRGKKEYSRGELTERVMGVRKEEVTRLMRELSGKKEGDYWESRPIFYEKNGSKRWGLTTYGRFFARYMFDVDKPKENLQELALRRPEMITTILFEIPIEELEEGQEKTD
jgi:tRNA(Ser,Leu) C12 N-acetylase TAN1